MARVHHARPQQAAHRSALLEQPRAAAKKKKPYKIVLEAVTQEKKKLHSILTYASNAPRGFGFVPAGHPEFTEWCKEQCRQRNLDVHIVSAKPKNKISTDPEKLSHHVHRVGHHFPIEIVDLACSKFGYLYDEAQGLRKDKSRDRTNWIAQRVENYSSRRQPKGRPTTEKESKEHTRGAVREMFPKIPEADLHSIVNHAFEEGTNRVGNAKELSLARRVQLAVVAHIRHMYTDYDKILKTGSWMEARSQVEHVSLAKLREWRDETGEHSNEIEDTFREVIVLDDEDESSDEGSLSTPDEREQSMEIVSSRAAAYDLSPEPYGAQPRVEVQASRRVPRRMIHAQPHPYPLPGLYPAPLSRPRTSQTISGHTGAYAPVPELRSPTRTESFSLAHSRPMDPWTRLQPSHASSRGTQPIMREIDGQLYHLEPITESHNSPRPQYEHASHAAPRYAHNGYVPPPAPRESLDRRPAHSRRTSEQDLVLPSVERETVDLTSPRRTVNVPPPPDPRPASRAYVAMQSPKRKPLPSFADSREIPFRPNLKRPRPLYYEDEVDHRAGHAGVSRLAHESDYQSLHTRSQPMAPPPPPQAVIDLTYSPCRAPVNGDAGYYAHGPGRALAEPNGFSYISVPPRLSPVHDARVLHYEAHPGEQARPYMSNSGMFERRAPPVHDYISVQDARYQRLAYEEGVRNLRSGMPYAALDLQ